MKCLHYSTGAQNKFNIAGQTPFMRRLLTNIFIKPLGQYPLHILQSLCTLQQMANIKTKLYSKQLYKPTT
jgi:hypothetical protein